MTIKIEEQELSDGSMTYAVILSETDGRSVTLDCKTRKHAEWLQEQFAGAIRHATNETLTVS